MRDFLGLDFWHDFTPSDTITFANVPLSTVRSGGS
jgi:hypothetical protein